MCVRFGQDTSDEKSRKFGSAAEENSRGKPTRGRDKEFLQLHNKRTACFLPLIKTPNLRQGSQWPPTGSCQSQIRIIFDMQHQIVYVKFAVYRFCCCSFRVDDFFVLGVFE
jgi:hypothetical protein